MDLKTNSKMLAQIKKAVDEPSYSKVFFTTYLAYLSKIFKVDTIISLKNFLNISDISSERKEILCSELDNSIDLNKLNEFIANWDIEILKSFLIEYEPEIHAAYPSTPDSITRLAYALLDLDENEEIVDFGSGTGSFLRNASSTNPNLKCKGIEINPTVCEISRIKIELQNLNITIENASFTSTFNNEHKYSRIFSNFPWNVKISNDDLSSSRLIRNFAEFEDTSKISSDWVFSSSIIGALSEKGKAIAIISSSSVSNEANLMIRECIVESWSVEAIISLPPKLFPRINQNAFLVIFSNDNDETMLVNASDIYTPGRRINYLSEENIATIVSLYKNETELSKKVSLDLMRDNYYVLSPKFYLEQEKGFIDSILFKDVIKSITRGSQISAKELDELKSNEPTNYQYMGLSNIRNGFIDKDLPYIKKIDKTKEKYCIKNNNIIISKNGLPIKKAIVELSEDKQILANGNLYIIEIDETKIDPYFLMAFLDDPIGESLFTRTVTHGTQPIISVDAFSKIGIPLLSPKEMERIGKEYKQKLKEVKETLDILSIKQVELALIWHNYLDTRFEPNE